MRLRPRTCRISCRNNEIPSKRNIGGNHIVYAVIIADGRGENAARHAVIPKRKLRRAVKDIADLPEMAQILARKNRHTREIGKGGIYNIIGVTDPADGRVRVKTG